MPSLKRIKVSTLQELRMALSRGSELPKTFMVVTHSKASPAKHIASADVRQIAMEQGFTPERSYTLSGSLIGHVISHTA